MDYADVFIVGTGDLGGWVLEILARSPGMEHKKILVGDVNEETCRKRTFSAWAGTSFLGHSPEMEFVPVNLFKIDQVAELLKNTSQRLFVTLRLFNPGGLWMNFLKICGLRWKRKRDWALGFRCI